jgi:3-hydroxyisobutyrate dehydrogenase-like beta-hydroxyacid dehydrogenase
MKIAFFGTGLMGSGFVRRLRANGHDLNVWNRSPAKARALQAHGATAFDDPGAALAGAQRIHLSLSDDASVDAVLEPIAAGDFGSPSFEMSMARKDERLMMEEARRGGVDLFVMPGVAAMFDAAIARGEGALDSTAAARIPD